MKEYTKETDLKPKEVIDLADDFFGQDGVGMVRESHSEDEACYKGEGGRVEITACQNDKTEVKLKTRELDWQIKKFLRTLES